MFVKTRNDIASDHSWYNPGYLDCIFEVVLSPINPFTDIKYKYDALLVDSNSTFNRTHYKNLDLTQGVQYYILMSHTVEADEPDMTYKAPIFNIDDVIAQAGGECMAEGEDARTMKEFDTYMKSVKEDYDNVRGIKHDDSITAMSYAADAELYGEPTPSIFERFWKKPNFESASSKKIILTCTPHYIRAKEDEYKASQEYKIQEANSYLVQTDWVNTYKIRHDLGLELIPEDSSKWEVINKRAEYIEFLKGAK
jgi:hypothetical protein